MSRISRAIAGALLLGAVAAQAAYLPYPEPSLKYNRIPTWDDRLSVIYEGWKARFVKNGLVGGRTPTSPDVVSISEGQSYGMMLAVWFGDREGFNSIWSATESKFWTGNWYRWIASDNNFAGDADIDICGALIFASALVDAKYWADYTVGSDNYKSKAKKVLQSIITNFIDKNNNYRINSWPGAGDGIRNPSYHMPGWYPIFKEFAAANGVTGMDWDAAAKGSFDLIEAQTNSDKGMARNFSNGSGGRPSGGTSSPNNYDMGWDAIRVPYRMAMSALWYKNPRALSWGASVWSGGVVKAGTAGLYSVDNTPSLVPAAANYEVFMPRAMWGALAVAVQDESSEAKAARDVIVPLFASGAMGGNAWFDGTDKVDVTSSKSAAFNYYAQSLGLLGALVMSGRAWNVWDDIKNPWTPPDTTLKLTTTLKGTKDTVVKGLDSTVFTAAFNRGANWTVSLKGRTSGAVMVGSGSAKNVRFVWKGAKTSGSSTAFGPNEIVDVTLEPLGVKTTVYYKITGSAVKPATRGSGAVRLTHEGIWLDDPAIHPGESYAITIRDLAGRINASVSHSVVAQSMGQGVVLPLGYSEFSGVRLVEISNFATGEKRQYIFAPSH